MLAQLVVALLVLLLRPTLATLVSCGCVCRLTVFLEDLTICVVDSPETGYFTLDAVEYECFTGVFGSLTDFDESNDDKNDFLGVPSVVKSTVGVVLASDFLGEVSTCQLTGLSLGWRGMTKALVCLSSERSLHSADIRGRSILRLFSRSVRMSNSPSAAAAFSPPDVFEPKDNGAG